ncbi:hypothetical protein [Herbiconiux sp. VKM Ac-2851]|uniref:hypothetical protein n=1 Tax=Herbiconiux sp. VKM Ac-2851 TaxID=2739025 RepID=UPI0015653730|nr:hypothetical protein [Herbiconiux sp. VKM Ac-2851]NQX36267.1 hypothetical protein [Herbiconiux sp. VKM Ac-2851]
MSEIALVVPTGAVLVNPSDIPTGWLSLDAQSLLSKWGFGDGDKIGDWWWDHFDEPLDSRFPGAHRHDVLRLLVRLALVPAIEAFGHAITVYDIGTIHNPVRAETVDGITIDHYNDIHDGLLDDIWVAVSPPLVVAAAEHGAWAALAASAAEGDERS